MQAIEEKVSTKLRIAILIQKNISAFKKKIPLIQILRGIFFIIYSIFRQRAFTIYRV
jgi:hypothetical protein